MINNNSELINQTIYNEIKRIGLPQYFANPLIKYVKLSIPKFIKIILPKIKDVFEKEKNNLKGSFKKSLKNNLIKLQSEESNISPRVYVDVFSKLNYRLIRSSCKVILGDSIILFNVHDTKKFLPIIDGTYELKAVILPIDSDKVLIGGYNDNELNLPDDINNAIAQCSLEYFISSKHLPDIEILSNEIGEKAAFFSKEEIDDIVLQALKQKFL